ncbi:MAG TPA: hypothetical protein VFF73_08010, partial [Planctomycetota bacterium]|nr:hypothetical protein [Planctomycetota bacterium]
KGWLAVAGLVVVLVGFGGALASTTPARVRYWAWRMRSSRRETRLVARTKLMEIGRPAIDGVFPELVSGEASDRLAVVPRFDRCGFVGLCTRRGEQGLDCSLEVIFTDHFARNATHATVGWLEAGDPFLTAFGRDSRGAPRLLIVGSATARGVPTVVPQLAMRLDVDDPLAPAVIEATSARIAELR